MIRYFVLIGSTRASVYSGMVLQFQAAESTPWVMTPKLTEKEWSAIRAALEWVDAAGDYSEFADAPGTAPTMRAMRRALEK